MAQKPRNSAFGGATLPIAAVLPAVSAALSAQRFMILQAPPGAGKTTLVPPALVDEPWLAGQRIVMLEPRRLAARAAAHRMATLLGERVGETVGYRMRLDTRVGPHTRIEVVTEGILTRMLQHDLSLDGVGLVIFDEFHERSLAGDTGLALTLATAEALRPDLRILVMSATLDHLAIANLLGEAPVIRSAGRVWPVETRYAPPRDTGRRVEAHLAQLIRDMLRDETGSLLVFLPGAGEIRRVHQLLDGRVKPDISIHPLHGSLTLAEQDAAIAPAPAGRRKVVLSTSIAETSLTIEGIRIVIDSGLMRVPRFAPRTGMTRLDTVRVSRATAEQRAGRAGRLEPGICIRCWHAAEQAGLVPYTRPEILDADLAPLLLDLARAGFADPAELRWLDSPAPAAVAQATALLQVVGALDQRGRITTHGTSIAELGAHPRVGHMLLSAGNGELELAVTLAALLDERDVFRGVNGPPPADVELRLDVIARDADAMLLTGVSVDHGLVQRVRNAAAEYRRRAQPLRSKSADGTDRSAGALLALAYPDRVAQRRGPPGRFLLQNGRGATLPLDDPLAHASWIVAAAIDDAGRDGRVTLAAAVTEAEVRFAAADRVVTVDDITWNDDEQRIVARRRTMLGALVLHDVAITDIGVDRRRTVLLDGLRRSGIGALPWSMATTTLRQRLAFLHHHDATWPDVSDATLMARADDWMAAALLVDPRLSRLASLDPARLLVDRLTWPQRATVDTLAPERITVPSGSQVAVDYNDPAAPALAVRLQEVFGMEDTPRILDGRVPLTMQLLSPARRPVQVTRDLASFWASGYFDVRKDLRGRYPRHYWPEDPRTAEPVRGAKRKR
jgi:ATP-dependent helicase HrpB